MKGDNGAGVFSNRLAKGLEQGFGASVHALTTVGNGLSHEKSLLYPNKLKLLLSLARIRAAIKTCDVVHALDAYPYGIIAVIASFGLRKKIILTAVGTGSVQWLYHRHWLKTRLLTWSYRSAVEVTAISRYTRDLILKKLPDLRITVINHGVDYEKFAPHERYREYDASLVFQNKSP